jgi:multidrug efflux pump subunit AcrA (membrane-fusion protein)
LDLRPESSAPDSLVIIKDPIRRQFYRFTAVQTAVLEGLDGSRDAGAVAREVSERFATPVTQQQIEDFAVRLRQLLLLDEQACWAKLEGLGREKKKLLANLLSIKIHAFNPDRLLTRLERKLRFCFRPGSTLVALASILAAVAISLANWDSLYVSLGSLFSLYSIPLVLLVAFAVMSVHEFAHGLTLKHFGGKVEEMGLLFLYFIPAFYCNVSDAWMLKKRDRIFVTLAGGYIQFVICASATIAWRFLAPETLASRVCLIVIGFSGIQTLFNFNPLIRLDGYYLLSDYLEIPNLRSKAFQHLRRTLNGHLFGMWKYQRVPRPGRREERIFIVYGTAAFIFTAGLIWIMLDRVGGWLVREYQTWGLLILSALCLMAIPVANREALSQSRGLVGGVLVRVKKLPRLVPILAALIVGGCLPWELKVSGDFTILPQTEVSVTPQVDGTLKAIHVDERDPVRSGAVLAEIENLELSNEYEETRGELTAKRASLDLLKAGTRPEEIERARRNIETKRAEYDSALQVEQERKVLMDTVAKKEAEVLNAQKNYERSRNLLAAGLIARNEAERDQTTYEVRQKELAEAQGELKVLEERIDKVRQVKRRELDQARAELAILQAGSRKEAIREMEAEVGKLEEKQRILEQQLEHLRVKSPIDGVVATPYLQNRIGEYIQKGDVFCRIVDVRVVRVDMPIEEKEIADVQLSSPIILKVRGYPKRSFEARVKAISPVALDGGTVRRIVVQGELENSEGILRPGMTGVGKILCGRRTVAELVTRRAVRWIRTEFWQYLP